jgi:hypothetical protein
VKNISAVNPTNLNSCPNHSGANREREKEMGGDNEKETSYNERGDIQEDRRRGGKENVYQRDPTGNRIEHEALAKN